MTGPSTPAEVHAAIAAIMAERAADAEQSPYDWKVCVRAVGVADDAFKKVAVSGDGREYCERVIAALTALRDEYYDHEGEYTSGRSDIGTIVDGVEQLLKKIPI
jgi:hypothetical protein